MKTLPWIFAILCFFTHSAQSDPSTIISKAMDTPASVFDVFLFQLHEKAKCRNFLGQDTSDICMTTIRYNYADNLITMHFKALETHKKLKGFKTATGKEKFTIAENALKSLANLIGITSESELDYLFSLIGGTDVRHGWQTATVDTDALKKEIARRTVVNLHIKTDDGIYSIMRDHKGVISKGFALN